LIWQYAIVWSALIWQYDIVWSDSMILFVFHLDFGSALIWQYDIVWSASSKWKTNNIIPLDQSRSNNIILSDQSRSKI
jgi:hypothetical protein